MTSITTQGWGGGFGKCKTASENLEHQTHYYSSANALSNRAAIVNMPCSPPGGLDLFLICTRALLPRA